MSVRLMLLRPSSRALVWVPVIAVLALLAGCATSAQREGGWFALRWIERPAEHGPSTQATEADQTRFELLYSYEHETDVALFAQKIAGLREGDVIAYRMGGWEATKGVLKGDLAKIGYGLLKYGHLAIVVTDPTDSSRLRVFSSESFKGPNIREDIDTLKTHSFDVYRLDKWERADTQRFHEFVQLARNKAGKWYGYDFSGMFGLWNSNMRPTRADEIGHDYICSTVVVTALYYSGIELDAIQRGGIADVVTPLQVVASRGRVIAIPSGELLVQTSGTEPSACGEGAC